MTPTPASGFRRRLAADALEILRTNPVTMEILNFARSSDDLDVQLRGSYVDVYFAGFNVFQIKPRNGTIRLGSEKEANPRPQPWTDTWMPLKKITSTDIPAAIDWVRDQRRIKLTGRESEFESKVVRDNREATSPVLVLDRQIVQPGWKQRLDLLLYDTHSERLVLAELKLISNKEMGGDFFEQLLRYQGLLANNPWIQATYPHVYEQKVSLGLVKHDLYAVRADRPPLLLFLLGGFDSDTTSKGKIDRLRVAAKRKAAEFRSLDVRVHNWADFASTQCRIPPLSQLPTFEKWFERNVSQEQ